MRLISCYLVYAGAVCVVLNGCAFYSYVPVQVAVTEIETGLPAAAVAVQAKYGHGPLLNPPISDSGRTGSDGTVVLSMAKFRSAQPKTILDIGGELMKVEPPRAPKTYVFTVPPELLVTGGNALFWVSPYPDAPRYQVDLQPRVSQ
jgi:hypothetical protein